MGARTSKDDDKTDDTFQSSEKMRLEDQMTEARPEIGTSIGDDRARGNHLDNQRIASGVTGSLGYL